MNTKLLKSILVLSVMGVAGTAYAGDTPLNLNSYLTAPTLNPADTGSFTDTVAGLGTSFTDNWYFNLANAGAGGSAVNVQVTVGLTDLLNIAGLTGTLYSANLTTGATIGSAIATGTSFNLPSLPSGGYDFVISGTTSGVAGGMYAGAVAAVPLPAAAWLLLSGLVGVGVMARRQKIDGVAA